MQLGQGYGGSTLRRTQTLHPDTASAHKRGKRTVALKLWILIPPQPNHTIALIPGSCLPLPKPQEALVGQGCTVQLPPDQYPDDAFTGSRKPNTCPEAGQLCYSFRFEAASYRSPCRREAYLFGTMLPPLFSVTWTQHMDVGATASRMVASLGRVETPSPRKCRCSIISSHAPLHPQPLLLGKQPSLPTLPSKGSHLFHCTAERQTRSCRSPVAFQVPLCINSNA